MFSSALCGGFYKLLDESVSSFYGGFLNVATLPAVQALGVPAKLSEP